MITRATSLVQHDHSQLHHHGVQDRAGPQSVCALRLARDPVRHFPELVYDHGGIDNSIPFAQWRQKAQIDKAAKAADQLDSVAFSKAIRVQLATR